MARWNFEPLVAQFPRFRFRKNSRFIIDFERDFDRTLVPPTPRWSCKYLLRCDYGYNMHHMIHLVYFYGVLPSVFIWFHTRVGIRAARPDPIFSNPNRGGPDSLQPDPIPIRTPTPGFILASILIKAENIIICLGRATTHFYWRLEYTHVHVFYKNKRWPVPISLIDNALYIKKW